MIDMAMLVEREPMIEYEYHYDHVNVRMVTIIGDRGDHVSENQ